MPWGVREKEHEEHAWHAHCVPAALLKHKALTPFSRNMAIESEMVAPHSVVKRTNGVEAVKRTPAYIMVVAYRGANRPASPDPAKDMSKRTHCTW